MEPVHQREGPVVHSGLSVVVAACGDTHFVPGDLVHEPVFIGDALEATATIDKIDRETRIVELSTLISNQRGQAVLRGKARAKVLRLSSEPAATA